MEKSEKETVKSNIGDHGISSDAAHTGMSVLPKVKLSHAPAGPNAYRRMIADVDRNARQGDLVSVYDKNGNIYGIVRN